jgi:hypothetical protein
MAASHGAGCSAECCLYRRIGALGSRRSHHCLAISGGPRWSSVDTVPRHRLRSRVHPLVSLALLLSSSCLRRPEQRSRACARPSITGAFLGVSHLFATSAQRVHGPVSIPGPPVFRPQRFARSRRLAPRSALQACFVPLPRPGFALQGVVPPTQPDHLVGAPSLRAVGTARLPPVARRRQQTARRPRGLDPSRDPQHPRGV